MLPIVIWVGVTPGPEPGAPDAHTFPPGPPRLDADVAPPPEPVAPVPALLEPVVALTPEPPDPVPVPVPPLPEPAPAPTPAEPELLSAASWAWVRRAPQLVATSNVTA